MNTLLELLGVPGTIAAGILIVYLLLQLIGELCEVKGKVVPEWMKLRKWLKRKRYQEIERTETLKQVQKLLSDVNTHYSEDNIAQRNDWIDKVNTNIQWTETRAKYYDEAIDKLTLNMNFVVEEVSKLRTRSEEDHAQRIRNKIIEFATKVAREDYRATRDEFNYIFNIHEEYDKYIKDHNIKNDQINDCMEIIREEHKEYIKHNKFLEAKRSLPN